MLFLHISDTTERHNEIDNSDIVGMNDDGTRNLHKNSSPLFLNGRAQQDHLEYMDAPGNRMAQPDMTKKHFFTPNEFSDLWSNSLKKAGERALSASKLISNSTENGERNDSSNFKVNIYEYLNKKLIGGINHAVRTNGKFSITNIFRIIVGYK